MGGKFKGGRNVVLTREVVAIVAAEADAGTGRLLGSQGHMCIETYKMV